MLIQQAFLGGAELLSTDQTGLVVQYRAANVLRIKLRVPIPFRGIHTEQFVYPLPGCCRRRSRHWDVSSIAGVTG